MEGAEGIGLRPQRQWQWRRQPTAASARAGNGGRSRGSARSDNKQPKSGSNSSINGAGDSWDGGSHGSGSGNGDGGNGGDNVAAMAAVMVAPTWCQHLQMGAADVRGSGGKMTIFSNGYIWPIWVPQSTHLYPNMMYVKFCWKNWVEGTLCVCQSWHFAVRAPIVGLVPGI